jgi:hypothetical protein
MGTASPATNLEADMIAIDFGAGSKLVVFPAEAHPGRITRGDPRWGKCAADKFSALVGMLLEQDDVVVESATVGSSGAIPEDIRDVVGSARHVLYTLPNKAVMNWTNRPATGDRARTDEESARALHEIATTNPAALKVWRYVAPEDKLVREHRSVRPSDKRGWDDDRARSAFAALPPYGSLPEDARDLLGDGSDYNRDAVSMALGLALTEPSVTSRESFERVLGLYGHGYPSFYRERMLSARHNHPALLSRAGARLGLELRDVLAEGDRHLELRANRKEALQMVRKVVRSVWSAHRAGTFTPSDEGTASPARALRPPPQAGTAPPGREF